METAATEISQQIIDTFLEPLSEATEGQLSDLPLGPNDYLSLDLDKAGTHFIAQSNSFRDADSWDRMNDADNIWDINGVDKIKTDNPTYNAAKGYAERIPERKDIGYGRYSFALTDFTALVIHHIWPHERIVFKSDDAKNQFRFLVLRFFSQNKAAEIVARFKRNGEMPELPSDYVAHPEHPLAPFQEVGLVISTDQGGKALFMEQGTGKTPIVVNRVNLEGKRKRIAGKGLYKVLIIAPGHCRANWAREFGKFSVHVGKVGVLRGDLLRRFTTLTDVVREDEECNFSAAIISTDSVHNTWEALAKIPWDLVVLDESHYIKDAKSRRSKACRDFEFTAARQRMPLTGTAMANRVTDLWAQLEFMGEGLSGFTTFAAFRSFHGKFDKVMKGATPTQRLVGVKALPLLQERLARLAYIITKKEANLQLPDKVYDLFEVEMTTLQTTFYRKLASELVVEIEEILEDENSKITADHILVKLLRLAQITSGFYKTDKVVDPSTGIESGGIVHQIPGENRKVQAVIEMVADPGKDPLGKTIVWACFVEDIRVLSEALHNAGINHVGYHAAIHPDHRVADASLAADRLNQDDTCEVFLGNPASASEGLNILGYDPMEPTKSERYVDHVIYFSCNWSMLQRAQSEDRAHRRGTRCVVRVTDLLVEGTIDEEIRARVGEKRTQAEEVQDVSEILQTIYESLKKV